MLKYANTTPQGREIIRKKLFKLKQELKEAGMVPSKVGLAPSPT
jgi:predicted SPOUT superfamily RNA methylase MTH1